MSKDTSDQHSGSSTQDEFTPRSAVPRSLYLHVPFCTRRCSYCDFAVDVQPSPPVTAWIEAISSELRMTASEFGWPLLHLETLYIGGGTPSLLGTGAMSSLLGSLSGVVTLADEREWTCEANPESFSRDLARDWKATGVNRISLGAQTFHEDTLRWMGRMHGVDGPGRAMAVARDSGFDNVSVDLIFGVPSRLGRDWLHDLRLAIDLEPDHVSLYGLTAEPGAPLGRWVQEGRETLAEEDRYTEEYLLAHEILADSGFEHYEVSNFARPGFRSRHNGAYWSGGPYAAAGPGAHAFVPPLRRWNLRSWVAYTKALSDGLLPIEGEERLDTGARQLEAIWLGLRTCDGYRFEAMTHAEMALVEDWRAQGLAYAERNAVHLTPDGWLLLDELTVDLNEARGSDSPRAADSKIDARQPLVQIAANSNPPR